VNDTTHFTSLARWRRELLAIVGALRRRCSGPIVLAGVPPLGRFTALPQPLRAWLGLRARILDAALREAIAADADVCHLPTPPLEPRHLARDGYHPSADGAAAWAQLLVQGIAPLLAPSRPS
jgi:lysophospholipase L1-like esterase